LCCRRRAWFQRSGATKTSVELNSVGITPDEIVVRTTDDIIARRDPPLDAAIAYLEKPLATPTP
jgi:hypothetical protein